MKRRRHRVRVWRSKDRELTIRPWRSRCRCERWRPWEWRFHWTHDDALRAALEHLARAAR